MRRCAAVSVSRGNPRAGFVRSRQRFVGFGHVSPLLGLPGRKTDGPSQGPAAGLARQPTAFFKVRGRLDWSRRSMSS
jgi:hypothetical protein